jgi:hypothetical protein
MLRRLIAAALGRGRVGPIEGTIADRLLQADVQGPLRFAMRANADRNGDPPPGPDWHVVKVEVLVEPPLSADGASVVGPWSERWTVEAPPGPAQAYTITFTPDAAGEMDFTIAMPEEGRT